RLPMGVATTYRVPGVMAPSARCARSPGSAERGPAACRRARLGAPVGHAPRARERGAARRRGEGPARWGPGAAGDTRPGWPETRGGGRWGGGDEATRGSFLDLPGPFPSRRRHAHAGERLARRATVLCHEPYHLTFAWRFPRGPSLGQHDHARLAGGDVEEHASRPVDGPPGLPPPPRPRHGGGGPGGPPRTPQRPTPPRKPPAPAAGCC